MLVQPMAKENTMEATYSLRRPKYSTTVPSMNSDCTKLRVERQEALSKGTQEAWHPHSQEGAKHRPWWEVAWLSCLL